MKKKLKKIKGELNKINKKLTKVQTINNYSTLLTGIIITSIFYILERTKFDFNILTLTYSILFILIGIFIIWGMESKIKSPKRQKRIKQYFLNLILATLGAIYIIVIINFQQISIQLITTIAFLIIFIVINLYIKPN